MMRSQYEEMNFKVICRREEKVRLARPVFMQLATPNLDE